MSVDAILADARTVAESLMTDTCTVTRAGGDSVYNPETGQYESGSTPVYDGKCRVQTVRAQAANPEAGESVFTVERVELQLPFGVKFQHDDVAEIVASQFNPDLVATVYRVTGVGRKSQASAQRLNVEVVT